MANQTVQDAFRSTTAGAPSTFLTPDQTEAYGRNGFLFLDGLFSPEETATIQSAVPAVMAERTERTVLEAGSDVVRSVYGIHQHDRTFSALGRHPRLIEAVREVLKSDVYIYQSKLNTKAVFGGDVWPWHQDYVFWQREDAMPAPRALTVAVFLDDVTEHNGPLSLIPGSHTKGVVETDTYDGKLDGYDGAPGWISNLVAKLKYTISREEFLRLAKAHDIVSPKGRAGSAIIFDCNVAHASSLNLSPFERRMALFTYNAIDNSPRHESLHRPEFLVSRDTQPVAAVADDIFHSSNLSATSSANAS